eukprot:PhF_6_TR4325/c1_g1_i1/m.5830/K02267/COX6B; cytochrome c oxidase subunit 6b
MVHPDSKKYQIPRRDFQLPHFTDFSDVRFAHAHGATTSGCVNKLGYNAYWQWLHCVGNWGKDHPMCKKQRFYAEKFLFEPILEKLDERLKLGFYDYTVLYGAKPWKQFVPTYQPVKKNRPGAYEFWLSRDFQPMFSSECKSWKEKAPILHDILVKGKKPVEE